MAKTTLNGSDASNCPDCDRCGGKTRLFGIEAHPTIVDASLLTYVCVRCDAVQTRDRRASASASTRPSPAIVHPLASTSFDSATAHLLASAFDAAWQAVQGSASGPVDAPRDASTRELLARHIIEMGKRGERNHQRLVEHALARLEKST
jgi:hypothetical protein